jgi:hypothetical protein
MSALDITFQSYKASTNQEWFYHNRKRQNSKDYPKGWVIQVLKSRLDEKLPIMFGNTNLTLRPSLSKSLEFYTRDHLQQGM